MEKSQEREHWESRWGAKGPDHASRLPAPTELVDVVEGGSVPPGPILVSGCGAGTLDSYLAGLFPQTVGMDIAFRAASEAKAFVTAEGAHSFLVAESPKLPFQAGSFGLIVDRAVGAIAPAARTQYFQEVDRLLKPGGLVLAYFHRPARGARSAWQRLVTAGPRRVVRWVSGKRGHRGLNPQMIRDLLPGSMELVSLAESALQPRTGARFTYALLRKASQAN